MNLIQNTLRPHLSSIALAIVATLFVIFGNDLNRMVKRQVKSLAFPLRVGVFICVCAFGVGAAAVYLQRLLHNALRGLTDLQLLLTLVGVFVGLGLLAEHKRVL